MTASELPIERPLAQEHLETGQVHTPLAEHLAHWTCHRDHAGVQWWLLDKQSSSTNTLSQAVLKELNELVTAAGESNNKIPAIVIRSAKANGFVAGAEISEFRGITDVQKIEAPLAEAHALMERLENLKIPTVALLHGFCLGAGLELALACRYRIARNDTKLGFPEVNLGLHPGLGGTMRLTRQVLPHQALQMMLTGKPVNARKAERMGLIDARGEERHFANAVRQVAAGKLTRRRQKGKIWWLNRTPARRLIAQQSEKQTRKRAAERHYPAPFALIDLWRQHGGNPEKMLDAERKSFAELLSGATAQNLVRVFFLREGLKANGKGDSNIHHVHVLGAGSMGGDIAAWCALSGFQVTLEDRGAKYIAPAMENAWKLFNRKLHSDLERRDAHDRLIPDLAGHGRRNADLIIEAVPEDLELKRKLFAELEEVAKSEAILATNTSSILLERLRDSLSNPSRLVGIHFFNPVARMQLVEVVRHDQVDESTYARAQAFVTAIDRLPVPVKSAPGFLVNRVLTPYLLESLALLDEGIAKEEIDRAAEQFGMPMGPVELADQVGLDICLHVAESLHENLDQPLYPVPDWLREKVERGELGRKSGQGFYHYKKGKAQKESASGKVDKDLQDRLILPMVNTCVQCRAENIVRTNDEVDGAVIFATGFAPFTGGPLHYAETRGVDDIVETLERFARAHGDRFQPASQWKTIVDDEAHHDRRESAAA